MSTETTEHRVLQWVGGLPARWETAALGTRLKENKSSNKGLIEKQVLSLSYGRVIVKPEEKLRGLVPESFETYQILEPGDIVIRPTDLQNDRTSLRIGLSHFRGIITSAYIAVRPQKGVGYRYAAYMLAAYDFMKVFYGFGSGLRQNLDFKHIKHIPIPVPPLDEQTLIVRYLDHAELRIAKAIAGKSELVKLLEEKRKVAVEDIVLGGHAGHPLSDTGLPWAGRVPAHWDLVPFRSLLRPRKRVVGNRHSEFSLLSLTLGGVILRDLSEMKGKFPASFDTYQEVREGDFVMCLFDVEETPRTIGLSALQGMITGAYDVFESLDPSASAYIYEFLLTVDREKRLQPLYRGLRKTVPRSSLLSMQVPLPPIKEREEIVDRVRAETSRLDSAVHSLRNEIALLKEYRTRLISDVVTGKIDIREEAAKLTDIDPAELARVVAGGTALVDEEEAVDDE